MAEMKKENKKLLDENNRLKELLSRHSTDSPTLQVAPLCFMLGTVLFTFILSQKLERENRLHLLEIKHLQSQLDTERKEEKEKESEKKLAPSNNSWPPVKGYPLNMFLQVDMVKLYACVMWDG